MVSEILTTLSLLGLANVISQAYDEAFLILNLIAFFNNVMDELMKPD